MAVQFIKQLRVGLCGAACAQMVLHARGLIGTTPREQRDLWEEIKARTTGVSTANPGLPDSSPCEPVATFPKKICEGCSKTESFCWCTHPNALKATLLAHAAGSGVRVITRIDEDDTNHLIEACLSRGEAPIVLVNSGQHWVVVDGFDRNAILPVSILDPNPLNAHVGAKIEYWNDEYLAVPTCGKFTDKYVVVGADR